MISWNSQETVQFYSVLKVTELAVTKGGHKNTPLQGTEGKLNISYFLKFPFCLFEFPGNKPKGFSFLRKGDIFDCKSVFVLLRRGMRVFTHYRKKIKFNPSLYLASADCFSET